MGPITQYDVPQSQPETFFPDSCRRNGQAQQL